MALKATPKTSPSERRSLEARDDAARAVEKTGASQPEPVFVVEPSRGRISLRLKDVWEYRELVYFLIWRDIKARYKQTALGIAWALLQPLVTMAIFSIVFGYLGKIPSEGKPYPIFTFVALLPWQLFANSLAASSHSLVINHGLLTKVYFPRLIVPTSAVFAGLVDFSLAFIVLIGMMAYYGVMPTIAVLALPLFVGLAMMTALAVGLWLSALNVQYRDVQHTIPFLIQFWLFATPIAYPSAWIPDQWRAIYALNPMVGVVEGFRWSLLGQASPFDHALLISVAVVIILLASGIVYFRRMENTFADMV